MTRVWMLALVFLLGHSQLSFAAAQNSLVDVTFSMTPPRHFRQSTQFFISGNHGALGNWNAAGLPLVKVSNQLWQAHARLPKNFAIEFKVTLGSWQHAEVDNDDVSIGDRFSICDNDCEIEVEPENFHIEPFHAKPSSTLGHIEYLHEIKYDEFDNKRSIAIYLPPKYFSEKRAYPVIYATDGQNLFDTATASFGHEWELDKNLEALIKLDKIPPVIVVGIYSTERRQEEYLMNPKYVEFIINKIKPYVDQHYRTRPERDTTYLMGSSWGANFSLFAGWQYATTFSRLALLSGDFDWDHSSVVEMVKNVQPALLPKRIWMDMGDNEYDVPAKEIAALEKAYEQLLKSGVDPSTIHKEIVPGGDHSETSWALRIGRVLEFLLN